MSRPRQNLLLIWVLLALGWAAYGISQPAYRFAQDSSVAAFIILPPAILFLIGWVLLRVWEIGGEVYWLRLPVHLRRGLLRLYIAVGAPWIVFFGYRLLDSLQHPYQHHTSEAFWSLLIVPVGGPILLLVIMWVLAGFRKSEQTASDATHGAKIDPRASQPQPTREPPTDTRNAKSPHDYTDAGKGLGRIFFEPDVWHEMIKLGEFAPDGLVASEAALARIAIIRDAIRRLQPHSVATQMLAGIDQYVGEAFKKPERATTATLAIRLYEQNVLPLTRLSDVLARRLSMSRVTAVEIAPVLKEAAAEAEQLMKVSSALQKLSEPTLMDEFVKLAHGGSPPSRTANLREAIQLSYEVLLGKVIDIAEVQNVATELYNRPLPYSTHNLAVATALNLFRSANIARHQELESIQITSRMTVLDWVKEKKLSPLLAKTFEDTLSKIFKPKNESTLTNGSTEAI